MVSVAADASQLLGHVRRGATVAKCTYLSVFIAIKGKFK